MRPGLAGLSVLLLTALVLPAVDPGALAEAEASLTAEERDFLAHHGPLLYIADENFPPFALNNSQGHITGINVDFLRLMSVNLGIEFETAVTNNFTNVIDRVQSGEADFAANLASSPARAELLDFTPAYAYVRVTGWARSDHAPMGPDLAGQRIVVVNGTVLADTLPLRFPNATVLTAANDTTALAGVTQGRYDIFFGGAPTTVYRMRAMGIESLGPVTTLEVRPFSFAVAKGNAIVLGILEKGLHSITPQQRTAIFVKWTGVDLGPQVSPPPQELSLEAKALVATAIGATILLILWTTTLRRQVAARTRDLRHQAELAAESEAKFRALAETASDAIVSADERGIITYFNPGAERMFGRTAADVQGKDLTILMPERFRAPHKQGLARLRAGEASRFSGMTVELEGLRADGRAFPLELSIGPWHRADRTYFTAIIRDISDRKRAEAERMAALRTEGELTRMREQSALRAEFINMASHELATPLTPMTLQIQLMRLGAGRLDARQRRSLEILERNTTRLNHLVRDLLQAARIQAGKLTIRPQTMDLTAVAREALVTYEDIGAQSGIRFALQAPDPILVEADPARISQVLDNLLSNAVKFTPRGGIVSVDVSRDDTHAKVRVADTGHGMTSDQISRLFQPFSQVHEPNLRTPDGTGLGLFISKNVVELHGGRIWAESPGPGQGTVMTLALPLTAPRIAAAPLPPSSAIGD